MPEGAKVRGSKYYEEEKKGKGNTVKEREQMVIVKKTSWREETEYPNGHKEIMALGDSKPPPKLSNSTQRLRKYLGKSIFLFYSYH